MTDAPDRLSSVTMALSKEERAMSFAVKDPRFPVAVVEGTFKGERLAEMGTVQGTVLRAGT